MSLFLGPIHYWLYNKIQIQQYFVDQVIALAGAKWGLELEPLCSGKYGESERRALEEVIDESNIHGWLQNQLSRTEYKLAYCVTEIVGKDATRIEELTSMFETMGQEKRNSLGGATNLEGLFKVINDTLVDGMPCDHVNETLKQNEEEVIWRRNTCIHRNYWESVGGDVKNYYILREAWLKGFVESGAEQFEKLDEVTYALRSKKKQTSIDIMMEEHRYIERMLVVVRKACMKLLNTGEASFEDFEQIIDFIRNYADKHHHGKEEKFLFKSMEEQLGDLGVKLIRGGMYVEHDLGRLYIQDLEAALIGLREGNEESKLDVIAHAISYTHLLERHIAKEDEVVYKFGEQKLSDEILKDINEKTEAFEQEAQLHGVQAKYIALLEKLEEKYSK